MTDTTKPAARTPRKRAKVPQPDLAHRTDVVDALAAPGPRLMLLPADSLVADDDTNIRRAGGPDGLQDSIAQVGVLQPVIAYPDPVFDGKYRVLVGHRRARAAQALRLEEVPTIVGDTPTAADRIVDQLAENTHRQPMTHAEEAAAYLQLALFGMPADQIAARTARPIRHVDAAILVAGSPQAADALTANPGLTLVDAARLLEFEDDPETYNQLAATAAGDPDRIDHELQYASDRKQARRELAEQVAGYRNQGITILADDDDKTGWTDMYDLRIPGGASPETLRDAMLPHHAGDLACRPTSWGIRTWMVRTAAIPDLDGIETRPAAGKTTRTDEEKAQARLDRHDKTLWASATTVRRDFIAGLINRPKPPKGWDTVVAWHIAGTIQGKDEHNAHELAEHWLGITGLANPYTRIDGEYIHVTAQQRWLALNPAHAARLALAAAVAGFECFLERVDATRKPWRSEKPNVGPYLEWLASCGYALSQIEEDVVAADRKRGRKLAAALGKGGQA